MRSGSASGRTPITRPPTEETPSATAAITPLPPPQRTVTPASARSLPISHALVASASEACRGPHTATWIGGNVTPLEHEIPPRFILGGILACRGRIDRYVRSLNSPAAQPFTHAENSARVKDNMPAARLFELRTKTVSPDPATSTHVPLSVKLDTSKTCPTNDNRPRSSRGLFASNCVRLLSTGPARSLLARGLLP